MFLKNLCFIFLFTTSAQAKPLVVSSFSIINDFVKELAQTDVTTYSLVGPNEDAHTYQTKAKDAAMLGRADLILINGLYFETWMDSFVRANGLQTKEKTVSTNADIIVSNFNTYDPHAWQDIKNAKVYVQNIAHALSDLVPSDKVMIEKRAKAYLLKLDDLDKKIRAMISSIPAKQRKLITTHDAFSYYARAYGLELFTLQSWSTDQEATPQSISALVKQIKTLSAKAVFLENMTNKKLIEQIAKDTHASIGGTLYSDALSLPTEPADTYYKMMLYNTQQITKALGGQVILQ